MIHLTLQRRDARRLVVKDLYIQGMSSREMAEYVGCSIPTIYKDLFALGLKEKGSRSPSRRAAIARGVKKARTPVTGPRFCSECGRPAQVRFQKKWWCDLHLADAGADPDYIEKQRAAAGQRHASHGRDMK